MCEKAGFMFLGLFLKLRLTRREKGVLLIRRLVLFWNLRISIKALVPGLNLLFRGDWGGSPKSRLMPLIWRTAWLTFSKKVCSGMLKLHNITCSIEWPASQCQSLTWTTSSGGLWLWSPWGWYWGATTRDSPFPTTGRWIMMHGDWYTGLCHEMTNTGAQISLWKDGGWQYGLSQSKPHLEQFYSWTFYSRWRKKNNGAVKTGVNWKNIDKLSCN